ncbi:hypothetical protein F2Q69_00001842 [Brassica cretica]|uniref:Fumarate lyase N-terminal domain-containing protein n=1 Tax=Brassica cretica TaxID=69181 RepID=A0A8S9PA41_BRACR|nr:hypothetical protein F2Q69_00001842 [Brassica cretica]
MSSDKEVKLWGGRFEESVTEKVEKFTESISFDKVLYKQYIMGSKAHATMLAHQGLITDGDRDIILRGLDEIERKIQGDEFEWRTDREDVHMNIEAALTDLIGDPSKKLHTARSRNDQVATDFRLWCSDAIDTILVKIKHLQTCSTSPSFEQPGFDSSWLYSSSESSACFAPACPPNLCRAGLAAVTFFY